MTKMLISNYMDQINRKSFKESIQNLIKGLRKNPKVITNLTSNLHSPCREHTFDIISKNFGVRFLKEIESFYEEMDGLSVSWSYDRKIEGEINILPIMDTMLEEEDEYWKENFIKIKSLQNPRFQDFISTIFSIEVYDEVSQKEMRTVIEIDKQSKLPQNPNLWIWQIAGERYPLSIHFEEYIKILEKTRGFYGWTYFFIDLEKCNFKDEYFRNFFASSYADAFGRMREFLTIMPKIFPQDDFSEFEMLQENIIKSYESS